MPFDPEERRHLGRTPLQTQLLGLGTVPLGGWPNALSEEQGFDMLDAAWASGVRTFDTAPLYGCGLAEERLGAFLRGKPRDEIIISSKVGRLIVPDTEAGGDGPDSGPRKWIFDFSHDGILRSFEASLKRLDLDRLDILLLHDPDNHMPEAIEGGARALYRLRDEGLVTAIGAGMNQNPALRDLVANLDLDVILLAGRYTILDQTALDDLMPICDKRGTSILVGGVFNSGVLNNPIPGAYFDYLPLDDAWRATALVRGARKPESHETAEYWLSRAQAIKRICDRHEVTVQAAALQFAAAHPLVCSIVVGAGKPVRFHENMAAMTTDIPEQFWLDLQNAGLIAPIAPTPG